jgi:hypothetical protein
MFAVWLGQPRHTNFDGLLHALFVVLDHSDGLRSTFRSGLVCHVINEDVFGLRLLYFGLLRRVIHNDNYVGETKTPLVRE